MGVGCRLCRLPPSWLQNDWSEVAEVMAVGRRFHSLMVWGKKELNRTGRLVCSWCRCCARHCSSCPGVYILAEAGEVDVSRPAADPLQHQESVMSL